MSHSAENDAPTCPGCTEHHLTDQHAPGDPDPMTDGSAWVSPHCGGLNHGAPGHECLRVIPPEKGDDDLERQRQQPWHPLSRGWVG